MSKVGIFIDSCTLYDSNRANLCFTYIPLSPVGLNLLLQAYLSIICACVDNCAITLSPAEPLLS